MKLLTVTTRYYLLLFFLILGVWSLVFYFVLKGQVYQNSDEVLLNRKNQILSIVRRTRQIPAPDDPYNDFVIHPLTRTRISSLPRNDQYSDTLIYEPTDQEFDEYRKLKTAFTLQGQPYEVVIFKPRLESTEMINTLSITLPLLYVVLVIGLVVTSRKLSKSIWQPFYTALLQLQQFRIDQESPLALPATSIEEFKELQESVTELTGRSQEMYGQQKQFIENASHEIQTPLAIIQSKLELLLQHPINEQQAAILSDIGSATERLSKLNSALLLLSKIENNQFTDRTSVLLKPMVEQILTYFEEQAEKYQLLVKVDIPEDAHVHTNPALAEILLTNLIKNAFVHNITGGRVQIRVMNRTIHIENSGEPLEVPAYTLFKRFHKQSNTKGGLGLGLAIVKAICQVNKWKVQYTYQNKSHQMLVSY